MLKSGCISLKPVTRGRDKREFVIAIGPRHCVRALVRAQVSKSQPDIWNRSSTRITYCSCDCPEVSLSIGNSDYEESSNRNSCFQGEAELRHLMNFYEVWKYI